MEILMVFDPIIQLILRETLQTDGYNPVIRSKE